MDKKKQSNVQRIIGYYKPYTKLFLSDMFFALVASGVTLVLPLIVRRITSDVIYWEPHAASAEMVRLSLLMVFLVLVEMGSNFYITSIGHVMGAHMETDMRRELFTHYQELPFSFYDDQKVGQLMTRITNDLFEISELFHHGPEDIVISIIKFVGSFLILAGINMKLAFAAFALIPPMFVFAFIFNRLLKKAFRRNREKIGDINAQLEDSLSGVRVVKSFANEEEEIRKFNIGNDAYFKSKKRSYFFMATYNSGLNGFTTMIQIVVLAAGAFLLLHESLEVTDLITFLLYIGTFTEPVKKLINFTEQFQNGATGYARFLEMLEVEPEIVDAPDAVELTDVKGDVDFEHVTFAYKNTNDNVLANLDLHIPAGQFVALVGPSGAGKTTICNMIPRFYEATEGRILVDGKDVTKVTQSSLRTQIGIVQQEVYLFAGTVLENIRYGKPDATEEEIIEAAKQANAHEFIMQLPEGYNTDIGQRGVKLSGGQKQRLSIARVFLKNPSILILDEATSALDNESERIVQESLERLAKNRTTLVIAHRLSTIHNAQKILVLTEDGIAEQGTHSELLAKGGIYAKLYQVQFT